MANLDHLSYSSINSFLMCGEGWRRQYVEQEPAPVSDALVLGSAFHGAVEAYLKGAPDLEAAYEQAWSQQLERDQDVAWETGTPGPAHDTGLRMVQSKAVKELLADIAANFDPEHGIIEKRVELRVPGVPIPIIGYIDIITADGIPGDFKTAARMWSEGKADDELQPLFYLAALNQSGIQVPDWKFRHYVFTKAKNPTAKVFETQRSPTEVFGLFEIVRRAWLAIDRGVYLMQPGTWKCSPKYCSYWSTCMAKYV